ncbi:MAG: HDOD domain-containing protein [Acidobacteria bacterium]|nr:HDOD domain-containing protein [Acidobacteriota bacterium]
MVPVRLCNLPPFPAVAVNILSEPEESKSDIKRLATIVEGDPALAADILFLANSSLFGFPARIDSVRHAVAVLGADRVNILAVTVAMRQLARGTGPLIRPVWEHSIACAIVAARLAPLFGCAEDQSYTAGLLHDVGRLGFLRSYPVEIGLVMRGEFENLDEAMATEQLAVKADHGQAGAWLVEYWALPPSLALTCEHHHAPLQEREPATLQVVKIACRVADALGYSVFHLRSSPTYEDVVRSVHKCLGRNVLPPEAEMRKFVEDRSKLFQH